MHRTKAEQETIIRFDRANSIAVIYTFEPSLKRKVGKLAKEYPEAVQLIREDDNGSITYSLPKKLISIRKPNRKRTQTAEELLRIENLKKISSNL